MLNLYVYQAEKRAQVHENFYKKIQTKSRKIGFTKEISSVPTRNNSIVG